MPDGYYRLPIHKSRKLYPVESQITQHFAPTKYADNQVEVSLEQNLAVATKLYPE